MSEKLEGEQYKVGDKLYSIGGALNTTTGEHVYFVVSYRVTQIKEDRYTLELVDVFTDHKDVEADLRQRPPQLVDQDWVDKHAYTRAETLAELRKLLEKQTAPAVGAEVVASVRDYLGLT